MQIAWFQVIVALVAGLFIGPWVLSMFTGKKAASSGGNY